MKTSHATERWQQRVEPRLAFAEAQDALDLFLARGRSRPTPRHWTRVRPHPGLTFHYWSALPDVCALVVSGVAVTVISRVRNEVQIRDQRSRADPE